MSIHQKKISGKRRRILLFSKYKKFDFQKSLNLRDDSLILQCLINYLMQLSLKNVHAVCILSSVTK